MFNNLDWETMPHYCGSVKVGKVNILPRLDISIEKWGAQAGASGHENPYYCIGYEAWGNSGGLILDTREEVEKYLIGVFNRVATLGQLQDKREAIANRMKPLNIKWDKINQQIHAELKHTK